MICEYPCILWSNFWVSCEIFLEITDQVLDTLHSLESIEMHDLFCCLRLWNSEHLSSGVRERLQREIGRLLPKAVTTSPEKWRAYGLRPLQVIHSPDSPFMGELKEAVSLNLDFELEEQNSNGSWSPTWSWGTDYPESWELAKKEWAGVLTLEKLKVIKKFGRLNPA